MLIRLKELMGGRHGERTRLANHLGVTPNNVTEWTSGRSLGYRNYDVKIAEYYGVSLDWLKGITDERNIKNAPTADSGERIKNLGKAIALLNGASDEELRKALQVLETIL